VPDSRQSTLSLHSFPPLSAGDSRAPKRDATLRPRVPRGGRRTSYFTVRSAARDAANRIGAAFG